MIYTGVYYYNKLRLRLILFVPFVSQIFTAVGFIGYLCFKNGQKVVNNLAEQLTSKVHQIGFLNLLDFRGSGRYFYQAIQIFKDIGYRDYVCIEE